MSLVTKLIPVLSRVEEGFSYQVINCEQAIVNYSS